MSTRASPRHTSWPCICKSAWPWNWIVRARWHCWPITSRPGENGKKQFIITAWQAGRPQTLHIRLPGLNRQNDDQTVKVCWTIAAPEDAQFTDKVGLRRWRLARLLRQAAEQGGKPTHQQLAEALDVSLRTVTQGLAALRPRE